MIKLKPYKSLPEISMFNRDLFFIIYFLFNIQPITTRQPYYRKQRN